MLDRHPSDNLAAVLAACEYAGRSGSDFLTALAVAYQVQCRLSDAAPVRAKGFDHTTQGSYALAAGIVHEVLEPNALRPRAYEMADDWPGALAVYNRGAAFYRSLGEHSGEAFLDLMASVMLSGLGRQDALVDLPAECGPARRLL